MKKTHLTLIIIAILFTLFALVNQANAQEGGTSSFSPFRVLNSIIRPQNTSWTLRLPYLGGLGSVGSCLTPDTDGDIATTTCGSSSGSSFAWPFTPATNYVSTSTTLGFLNGFFSTASSTISGPFNLPAVALNSLLSTDVTGLVVATSTPTFGALNATSTTATSTFAGFITQGGTYLSPQNTATVCGNGCDYSSIETAVDSVSASSTIYIKNGTYALGATTITIAGGKNLAVIGQSVDGVQITYTGSGNAFTIGDSTTITRGSYLANFTIRGTSSGTRGLSIVNTRNSTFSNIYVTGFTSTGNPGQAFRLDGTGGYTGDNAFYYLRCDLSDYCLNLSGTAVNSNHFYGFTLRGATRSISLANANGNSFYGGLVGSPAGTGILFTSTGDENLVSGTYCEANATCVNLNSGANDNSLTLLNVETNTTMVTDSGSRNNVSYTGSDDAKTYFTGGNFGIGTSTPYSRLTVWGGAADTTLFEVVNSASTTILKATPNIISFPYSSSTIYSSFITVSSTNYLGAGLQSCDATTGKLTWSNGQFACGTDFNTGGGSGNPDFTYNTAIGYGITGSATSTKTQFTQGIHASSTSHFDYTTTTALTIGKDFGEAFSSYSPTLAVKGPVYFDYDGSEGGNSFFEFSDNYAFMQGTNNSFLELSAGDPRWKSPTGIFNLIGTNGNLLTDFTNLTAERTWNISDFTGSPALGSYVSGFTSGHIPFGSSGLLATSSSLTFDGTKLNTSYSSSTIYSSFLTASSTFANIGTLTLSQDLTVANGGTGASTLTGLLQGNGTSAFTAVTDSTTVGQILRVTGSNTYGWGALNLDDTDAFTGTLPVTAIEDVFLLNNGDVGTGVYDFGGATDFEIENNTNPTVDTAGEVSINTTVASSSLRFHDGTAERNLTDIRQGGFVLATSTLRAYAGNGTSTIERKVIQPRTIVNVSCTATTTGTAFLRVGDGTNWSNTVPCTTTGVITAISTNGSFVMGEMMKWQIGTISSLDQSISVDYTFRTDPD